MTATDEQKMWMVRTSGDPAAFEDLTRRWTAPLLSACERFLGDSHLAQDAVQETFAKIYARREHYQPTARFSSFLWQVAMNQCRDLLRKTQRQAEDPMPETEISTDSMKSNQLDNWMSAEPHPVETLAGSERVKTVQEALQRLPPCYREVVILRHFEDLKFHEIAEILQVPLGTVKSRMAEGLSRLSRYLDHLDAEDRGS